MDALWIVLLALCTLDIERTVYRRLPRHWQGRIEGAVIDWVGMPLLRLWRRL